MIDREETGEPEAAELGDAIAVVGVAGRFPGADDLATFWRNLQGGVESITRLTDQDLAEAGVDPTLAADPAYVRAAGVLDGIDRFDARCFGFSAREAELLDPQQRVFLELCWHALEDGGCDPARFAGRIGVFAGAGAPTYLIDHVAPGVRDPRDPGGAFQALLANDKDFLATRVSYKLDLRGPSLTVQTACSTSLVAVCLACQSLTGRECDAALAGGVSLRLPQRAGSLYLEEGIASPDGHCRAFDAEARGTVPASGAGVVLLKRLADAVADGDPVRAVIRGWALNNDGASKVGFTAPRAAGQAEAILEALLHAGIDPATVGYVEAHGTGTLLGDPIEVAALRQAFESAAERPLPRGGIALGSLKTNLGHLDAAAGVAGLIKAVLALSHRQIPPSLHFRSPNPALGLAESPFRVADRLADWPDPGHPRRAGVSSFGIGGTNAHVILEEAPPEAAAPRPKAVAGDPAVRHLLVLSAATAEPLAAQAERLARHLDEHPELNPADVSCTLASGRRQLAHRRALVFRDLAEAAAALRRPDDGRRSWSALVEPGHRSVAFLLPGQGSQHAGMGLELYHQLREPAFREALDECAELLAGPLGGRDLRQLLASDLDATELAQPALVAVEIACARLWSARGVEPEALLGHSVGELAAACLAGVFTLADTLALAAARGALVGALPGGAMLAVPLGPAELAPLLDQGLENQGLALAAENAPGLSVVAGPPEAIGVLAARLIAEGRPGRRLYTSHAFHSAAVDPALAPFRELVAAVERRPPRLPFLSNVTGTWITAEEATDPAYWARHLRAPVRFSQGAAALLAEPGRVLLEVGPGTALASLVRRQPAARGRTVVSTLPHPGDPEAQEAGAQTEAVLAAVAQLWLAGVALDAGEPRGSAPRRRLSLPVYPFERERHWIERPGAAGQVKRSDPAAWLYAPTYRRALPEIAPSLSAADAPAGWLLVGGADGILPDLAVRLREGGGRVVTAIYAAEAVRRGPDDFTLRAGVPGDAVDLLADFLSGLGEGGERPGRIVLLPELGPGAGEGSPLDPSGSFLLGLARASGRLAQGPPLQLVLVTAGISEVLGGESATVTSHRLTAQAAAAGLARVVSHELPAVRCRTIDLEAEILEGSASRLAAEVLRDPESTVATVALRGTARWELVQASLRPGAGAPALRVGGAYLITGGLGQLGLLLAEHLAGRWQARLTLLDQRPPSPEEDARLAALRAAGAEVVLEQADVTDPQAVAACLHAAARRAGPDGLRGIVHAAGVASGSFTLLAELGAAEIGRHLSPKVGGALALRGALASLELAPDFVLLCSSLAPLLGGISFGPFAAADAALAALAESWGGPWCAVDWEGWEGPPGSEEELGFGRRRGEFLMSAAEVVAAFERVLTVRGATRLAVATADLPARIADASRPIAPAVASASGGARSTGAASSRGPAEGLETRVAAIWQSILGGEPIGADDDFFQLGGDSLAGLQVLTRMRTELAVDLPLKTFFEARTVARMAAAIAAEQQQGQAGDDLLAGLLAEIEALSPDEVRSELEAAEEER